MSSGLSDRMKYLAMRAKKMTARDKVIPPATELVERFRKKKTEITVGEAQTLVDEINSHRESKGIGGRKPAAASSGGSKPQEKREVAVRKTTRSYGQ